MKSGLGFPSPKGAALWERLGEGGADVDASTPIGPACQDCAIGSDGAARPQSAPPSPNLSHDAPHLGEEQSCWTTEMGVSGPPAQKWAGGRLRAKRRQSERRPQRAVEWGSAKQSEARRSRRMSPSRCMPTSVDDAVEQTTRQSFRRSDETGCQAR